MPPLYQSTGIQYFISSMLAKARSLWGSTKRRKYQLEPAHWGMVSVSRLAGPPHFGQAQLTKLSMRARGDWPSVPGSKFSTSGSVRGSCS